MRSSMLFLFLITFRAARATCPCEGITLDGSDQNHCWQVLSRSDSTWGAADDACVAVGGHLGHPLDSNYDSILSYVQQKSSLPVLTGIVAGNTEIPLIGAMCQDNGFYKIVSDTTGFSNTPNSSATCSFIKPSVSKLVFDSCSINANVLCDRPLQKQDYCSIMATCATTTTFFSTTTTSATTQPSTTPSISSTSSATKSSENSSSVAQTTTIKSSTTPVSDTSGTISTSSTKIASLTTTVTNSGSGSGSATTSCKCPVVTSTLATTTKPSCLQTSECLKHQWKIFGMCVDWRAMLGLLLIGAALFLCCCICHCCMHACMFCTTGKREKE